MLQWMVLVQEVTWLLRDFALHSAGGTRLPKLLSAADRAPLGSLARLQLARHAGGTLKQRAAAQWLQYLRGVIVLASEGVCEGDLEIKPYVIRQIHKKKFLLLHLMFKVSSMMSRQKCTGGSFRQNHQERQGNLKSNLSC